MASLKINGTLLLHPVVGPTKNDDISYHIRILCYKSILNSYDVSVIFSLLPLAMRMAGKIVN